MEIIHASTRVDLDDEAASPWPEMTRAEAEADRREDERRERLRPRPLVDVPTESFDVDEEVF